MTLRLHALERSLNRRSHNLCLGAGLRDCGELRGTIGPSEAV
jgi:hypothetical protein